MASLLIYDDDEDDEEDDDDDDDDDDDFDGLPNTPFQYHYIHYVPMISPTEFTISVLGQVKPLLSGAKRTIGAFALAGRLWNSVGCPSCK